MEPLADPGAHDDHGSTLGLLGVRCEFSGDPDAGLRWHAGDLRLPGGRVRRRCVVVAAGPVSRQIGPRDSVLGEHEVEHRRDNVIADPENRDTAAEHGS